LLVRKALPALTGERPDLEGGYVAPRTPLEEVLAGLWQCWFVERLGADTGEARASQVIADGERRLPTTDHRDVELRIVAGTW